MITQAANPIALKLLPGALLLAALGGGTPAWANNLPVTNTLDETTTGNGCSLREAITNANDDAQTFPDCIAGSGADSITFSLSGTIPLGSTLFINDADGLTLDGSGRNVTVSGGGSVQVTIVNPGAALTVRYLTVANGGIFNAGILTVSHSTFTGNSALEGGGIFNAGILTVSNSAFSGNSAVQGGGGISNYGPLTVSNSTFSGNSAGDVGGGIFNFGTLTVTNSTFSGNSAGDVGGGIFNFGTLNLANTLLAHSTGGDCSNFGGAVNPSGVNLVEDGSCDPGAITGDPNLGPLADNGGPTQTHALLATPALSPAIDAADDTICANAPVSNLDQRGVIRPQNGDGDSSAVCDIGAYELGIPFTGFFAPVDNPPTFNAVKAGQGIPVKFSLGGDRGLDIFAAGYPKSQQIACDGGAPQDAIEQTVTAGGSSLSYDPATDTYTYVWKTVKAWAGTCRQLIVKLNDASDHTALFKFK